MERLTPFFTMENGTAVDASDIYGIIRFVLQTVEKFTPQRRGEVMQEVQRLIETDGAFDVDFDGPGVSVLASNELLALLSARGLV